MLSTTASINIDLQRPSIIVIHAKQFDALSRFAEIHLFSSGEPWGIDPSKYAYAVQYRKPDGTKGLYDKLPDGETDAVSTSLGASGEMVLLVRFAPQMFTVAGNVKCSVAIMNTGDGTKLQTCSFDVFVSASEVSGDESKDYYKMTTLEGLQNQIGDLDNLTTTKKESLVVAINEVAGKADNAATAAATAQQTADNAATAAGNAATAAATAQQTADQAATAAKNAVSGMDISRNTNGGYTAKWTENSKAKSASIYGGVGLARVTEILSFNTDTQLPMLHQSKIDGSHEYPVMIGDLIVYTGADYIGQVWSAASSDNVDVTVARKNEVFRVRAVSNRGMDDEYYNVERTGLVLQENGFVDRREEWLAWLLESEGQTSDADVSRDEVFRFLSSLPDGLHYLDNTACWGKFWAVNQSGSCVVFAPPDIYIVNTPTNILKLAGSGTLEKYTNADGSPAKSVDLLNSVPPKTTAADALKIWAVGVDGTPAWTAVPNAEEVAV